MSPRSMPEPAGAKPDGAAALYLRALCLQKQGSLLKAAAVFDATHAVMLPGAVQPATGLNCTV